MQKISIICKGFHDSGNYQTALKIQNHLKELYEVTISNHVPEDPSNMNLYIIIHLGRFSEEIKRIPEEIPLISIIAGTDMNEEKFSHEQMSTVINRSRSIVSLSEDLKFKFMQKWPNYSGSVRVIYQSVRSVPEQPVTDTDFYDPYFVFCGRLRDVKDPLFCLRGFLAWKKLNPRNKIRLVVIGDVEEEGGEFLSESFSSHPDVIWVKSMSQNSVFFILKFSLGLINTSKSEGQCQTIMEAFMLKVPVIARDNPGNLELLGSNGERGYLIKGNSIDSFVQSLTQVINDQRDGSIENKLSSAKSFILDERFNANNERCSYVKLVKDALESKGNC